VGTAFWSSDNVEEPSVTELVATILAGALALAGLGAIVWAALAKSEPMNRRALWTAKITLTLSGLVLFVSAFTGGEMMNVFGGLMLVIFGTGLTAVQRRSVRTA